MKKIFTLLCLCVFVSGLSAQNFMKFDATDVNGVKALNGLAHRTGVSELQILVPENFDLSNVVVDYQIAETDELLTSPLPTDYSSVQTAIVKNGAGVTKTWAITFKKVKPSTLPLTLDFSADFLSNSWTNATTGWAAACIDPADSNAKIVRFTNITSTFITAFSDAAETVSFKMNRLGADWGAGVFDILVSADGKDWSPQMQFNSSNPIPSGTLADFSFNPANNVRYVKWVYTFRGINVTMNNISITRSDSQTGIEDSQSNENTIYLNNNELVIADGLNVASIEVYNLTGSLLYSVKNPTNSVNLSSLAAGVYIAKASLVEGKIATLKFILK